MDPSAIWAPGLAFCRLRGFGVAHESREDSTLLASRPLATESRRRGLRVINDPDAELVERAKAELPRQTHSYRELVRRHSDVVFRRSARLLGNGADAEDAVQDVFLSVFRHLDRYQPKEPFSHWLATITTNTCLTHLRRRGQEKKRRGAYTLEPAAQASRAGPGDPILRDLLTEALDTLPPETRIAVVMRVLEERPYGEIANTLGLGESAAKMRVSRGCEALRSFVAERDSRTTKDDADA